MKDSYELFKNLSQDEKNIFNLIQKNGIMTKNEILAKMGMKLTSLNRIMTPLEKEHIIVQKCIGESTGGRKPVLYDVNVCGFYIIGIEISRTYVQVSMVNLRMEIFHKKSFNTSLFDSQDEVAKRILKVIDSTYVELNLEFLHLVGIGIAVETNLENKENVVEILKKELKCSIIIENGANSALAAEYLYGAGKQFKNLAYFNCGLEIREGKIIQEKIIRSANDDEYAFEDMLTSVNQNMDFSKIYPVVQQNSKLSESVILRAAYNLGKSIRLYINLLDLNCIILSGPLIKIDLFYETCRKCAPQNVAFKREGYFKKDAISIGAAALFLEKCIDSKI